MSDVSTFKGSPHGFGVLSSENVAFLQKWVPGIIAAHNGVLNLLEIGMANGYTMRGIRGLALNAGAKFSYTGIDGECGQPNDECKFPECTYLVGDSGDTFWQVPDAKFNLLFIDACHCSNHVILDFCNYAPKVVPGGYILFHDTHPSSNWQGRHYQCHGPQGVPDFNIAVRAGLKKLGLDPLRRTDYAFVDEERGGDGMGFMLFRKV